ncbi:MAG TPA: hypothetical protein VHC18_26420 [Amycolatopsis sp.]|nr:hypothetical protein [Amycolatopsis sp.]
MTTENSSTAPGFDTGLDLADLDRMDAAEAKKLLDWYESEHGDGQGDLTPFVPFFIEHRPAALKLYRQFAKTLYDESGLPQLVIPLNFLYYYMTRGNERGVLYEVVAARKWGATKREVMETLEIAFVHSGPMGGNAASVAGDYLRLWQDGEPRQVADPWPAHWVRNPVPVHGPQLGESVNRLFGAHLPGVRDAFEARVTHATTDTELPPGIVALYLLHSAVAAGRGEDAMAAAREALAAGLTKKEIVAAVGFAGLYATGTQLEEVSRHILEALD